jgi:metal transporter CNNM
LEITKASGTPSERKNAEAIIPIREQGNLLLCTLVLGNVAVTSLESILMADLTTGLIGFLLTTVLVVVFGEIVPQAFCARYGLEIGAKSVPIVRTLLFLFYPFTKPLALMLDWALGEEKGNSYTRAGINHLIKMHMEQGSVTKEGHIIQGALAYRSVEAGKVMTPRERMFALKQHDRLDSVTMELIFRKGFSRVPVWNDDETQVVGLLCA